MTKQEEIREWVKPFLRAMIAASHYGTLNDTDFDARILEIFQFLHSQDVAFVSYPSLKDIRDAQDLKTKRKMVEWLDEHRETYWQKPNGEVYMITRCKWTEEEWQALKKEVTEP